MLQQVFVIIFIQHTNFYHGVRLVVRIPETEGKILQ